MVHRRFFRRQLDRHTAAEVVKGVLAAWLLLACTSAGAERTDTIVLANANVPESIELARYYMGRREIPDAYLVLLDLPTSEVLSRKLYDLRMREPLLEQLRDRGFIEQSQDEGGTDTAASGAWVTEKSTIRFMVCMYGVPLKIPDTQERWKRGVKRLLGKRTAGNAAAVDSELATLLLGPGLIEGPMQGALFSRFAREEAGTQGKLTLVVGRLDGPDPETVRRMIDDALFAERYGLTGRCYFDARGLRDPLYVIGDFWIQESCERFLREGFECEMDTADATWGESYPMEDAAVYFGWYEENVCGPVGRPGFRFRPGAAAYHIHSSSAETLRSTNSYWAGPVLARGAAVTMGAVYEPYLSFTPALDVFSDRLCRGHTYGDSAYMSLRAVSWQITVVGDPLYRPFRYTLAEQIQHLEEDGRTEVEWAYIRQVNAMVRAGLFNQALGYCRQKIQQTGSLVLREKLGDLYARNGLLADAAEEYAMVVDEARTAETAVRAGAKLMRILRARGQPLMVDRVKEKIEKRWAGSPVLPWLETSE